MNVVNVKPEWSSGGAGVDSGARTATLSWTVLLSDPHYIYAPMAARLASGIPRYNEPHPFDSSLRVESVSAKPAGGPCFYRVTARYRSLQAQGSPLDMPWEIAWMYEETQVEVEHDVDGTPILNTAGEAFDPPSVRDQADPILTIMRNEAGDDPGLRSYYANVVNADTFLGLPPGTCRMRPITATRTIQTGWEFWRKTYTIVVRHKEIVAPEQAWWERKLNRGFHERLEVGGDAVVAKDEKGTAYQEPILLDQNGLRTDNAYWLLIQHYPAEPFSIFNLEF